MIGFEKKTFRSIVVVGQALLKGIWISRFRAAMGSEVIRTVELAGRVMAPDELTKPAAVACVGRKPSGCQNPGELLNDVMFAPVVPREIVRLLQGFAVSFVTYMLATELGSPDVERMNSLVPVPVSRFGLTGLCDRILTLGGERNCTTCSLPVETSCPKAGDANASKKNSRNGKAKILFFK